MQISEFVRYEVYPNVYERVHGKPFIMPLPLALREGGLINKVEPVGLRKTDKSILLVANCNSQQQEIDFAELAGFEVKVDEEAGPYIRFNYFKSNRNRDTGDLISEDWEATPREIVPIQLKIGIAPTHQKPWPLGDKEDDLWIFGFAKEDWIKYKIGDLINRVHFEKGEKGALTEDEKKSLKGLFENNIKAFPFSRIRNFDEVDHRSAYSLNFTSIADLFLGKKE